MRHRGRDRHQQAGGGRQRRSQTTGSHQRDHPVGQQRDFRVRHHDDVGVHRQLVALPASGFGLGRHVGVLGLVVVVLDATVAVLVLELQQTGLLPALHPLRTLLVLQAVLGRVEVGVRLHLLGIHDQVAGSSGLETDALVHRGVQVQPGHRGNGRRGGVQQGDEDQRPTRRATRVLHRRDGEESHDDVRQARGTDHQRQRVHEHVEHAARHRSGVLVEAEVLDHQVELVEQRGAGARDVRAQAELRQRVAGELQRDEDRRHQVGGDQHDVLRHLGVGDALHATEHCVHEHDRHADVDTGLARHAEEARERHTNAGHLADDVGQRRSQQADHRHGRRGLRVEAVADELRHGELAELAQVRGQQHRQQDVATGPAHQEQAAAVAHVGNQAGHGDEGRCRHPVGRSGHAVGDRVHAAARGIELAGAAGTRPDGDADVQREGRADHQIGDCLKIHNPLTPRGRRTGGRCHPSSSRTRRSAR